MHFLQNFRIYVTYRSTIFTSLINHLRYVFGGLSSVSLFEQKLPSSLFGTRLKWLAGLQTAPLYYFTGPISAGDKGFRSKDSYLSLRANTISQYKAHVQYNYHFSQVSNQVVGVTGVYRVSDNGSSEADRSMVVVLFVSCED